MRELKRRFQGRAPLPLLFFIVSLSFGAAPLLSGRDTDFTAYANAARSLRAGSDPWRDTEHPYLYPPLLAAALTPVVGLPARALPWFWMAASAAVLTLAVIRLAPSRRAVLLAILFAPLAATQWNLQANAFVLLPLVLAREALDRGDEVRGGLGVGIAISLKPLAVFVALWLLLSGRWKATGACLAAVGVSFLLVIPFLGAAGLPLALRHVMEILRVSWSVPYASNISLNGSLDRLFPVGATTLRHYLVAAAVLGSTALALFVAKRHTQGRPSAALDFVLAATLLAADASWLHQSTVLLPALVSSPAPLAAAAVMLYAIAAAWRFAGSAAVVAALAGTLGLALLWSVSGRRAAGAGP